MFNEFFTTLQIGTLLPFCQTRSVLHSSQPSCWDNVFTFFTALLFSAESSGLRAEHPLSPLNPMTPCSMCALYRDEIYSLQILLSRTQARPGRTVKQEQDEILPNHVQRINLISVLPCIAAPLFHLPRMTESRLPTVPSVS